MCDCALLWRICPLSGLSAYCALSRLWAKLALPAVLRFLPIPVLLCSLLSSLSSEQLQLHMLFLHEPKLVNSQAQTGEGFRIPLPEEQLATDG